MTLVILAATPILAGVGVAIGVVMAGLAKRAADAYGRASSIVAENLGSVRTVLAFNAAERVVAAYDAVGFFGFGIGFGVGVVGLGLHTPQRLPHLRPSAPAPSAAPPSLRGRA